MIVLFVRSLVRLASRLGQSVTVTAAISGEFFSGDKSSLIPAYGTHLFTITYSPLNVTTAEHIHKVYNVPLEESDHNLLSLYQ